MVLDCIYTSPCPNLSPQTPWASAGTGFPQDTWPGLHSTPPSSLLVGWGRDHRTTMPGIEDSEYPEQVISLPDPEKLEPKVTMSVKKQVFRADADGNTKLRDKAVTLEKADVEDDLKVPLSLQGRDEEVLGNQLWLVGASQIILWGAGNGMLNWVALNKRIPMLTIYESEAHKKVIMDFLLMKIKEAMNNPKNGRFYKSDADLGVQSAAIADAKATAKAKAKTEAKPKALPKAESSSLSHLQ